MLSGGHGAGVEFVDASTKGRAAAGKPRLTPRRIVAP